MSVKSYIKQNIGAIGAGAGAALAVAGLSALAISAIRKSKSKAKRKRSYSTVRKRSTRRYKRKGRRYTPHTAGKRRDTSHRRIRQTKTGQPYIILASGKARFISKKSARISRRRRGGRY